MIHNAEFIIKIEQTEQFPKVMWNKKKEQLFCGCTKRFWANSMKTKCRKKKNNTEAAVSDSTFVLANNNLLFGWVDAIFWMLSATLSHHMYLVNVFGLIAQNIQHQHTQREKRREKKSHRNSTIFSNYFVYSKPKITEYSSDIH